MRGVSMIGGFTVSRMVMALIAMGVGGMALDLLLLAHTEDLTQFIPFVVFALAMAAVGWWLAAPSAASVRAVRVAMVAMVIAGVAGVVLHYRANMEFQLELDRSARGFPLFFKVMEAKAPPALAPMQMALLGMIGLAAVFKERG